MTKEEIEDLSLVNCDSYEIELVHKAVNYIEQLEKQNKKQKEIIERAKAKMDSIFANGDNEKLLEDLLKLNNILEDKEETDINVREV